MKKLFVILDQVGEKIKNNPFRLAIIAVFGIILLFYSSLVGQIIERGLLWLQCHT